MKIRSLIALILALVLLFSFMNVSAEIVTYPLGDVNGDNDVNSVDYLMVKRACFNTLNLNFAQEQCADVNKDNKVDSLDYALIKRHCMKNLVLLGSVEVEKIPEGATVVDLVPFDMTQSVMDANTVKLQAAMDAESAKGGGTLYIPSGTYYFSSQGPNVRNVEEYVCMPKDNVTVVGAGPTTVLMPVGVTERGLDMFYFNTYSDSGFTNPVYLVNSDFRDLAIDGAHSNAKKYTSAGKGFMINLFKDCDYDNVIVRNTDGTGFGMDCPVNCTITNCYAYNNGKLATTSNVGASGFGIGTGYVDGEEILIENCIAEENTKFGFFFEHQGRFQSANPHRYPATWADGYIVRNCTAKNNLYDFGGELAFDVYYINCTVPADTTSTAPVMFRHHSIRSYAIDMNIELEFEDVYTSDSYYDAVYWAVNNGITTGTSLTKFSPGNTCTIAQALTFLYRCEGYPGELVLNNTSDTSTYQYPLIWAQKLGMVTSSVDTSATCTYNDIIKFMWIANGSPTVYGTYATHMNWAIKEGIIPSHKMGNVTRGEVVTIFYNYKNK